jgi:hypothetical protein
VSPIQEGDKLIRTLPTGLRVGFIVDDPGYRKAIGSIPAHFEVQAHRSAPMDSLESSDFWRRRRADFEGLSNRQRDALGIDREHTKWLQGFCSHLDDDELANGEVNGGLDRDFRNKFDEVATQAALALGCPPNADPVEFWLGCLCLDLLQNSPNGASRELLQPVPAGGFIVDLLGSSAAYCSRLAAMADRHANEKLNGSPTPKEERRDNAIVAAHPTPEAVQAALVTSGAAPAEIYYQKAPFFVYAYADDFPSSGQFAIENALRDANKQLECKGIVSFEEHKAVRIEWLWHLLSVVASTLGGIEANERWSVKRRREMLYDFGLKAADAAGILERRFKTLIDSEHWQALNETVLPPLKSLKPNDALPEGPPTATTFIAASIDELGKPGSNENTTPRLNKASPRRGRRPNAVRRDAIRCAINKYGDEWRDHLLEIFAELDTNEVQLGDFQTLRIDLEDGQSSKVLGWADLDLAQGKQRRQIVDALRKYTD